MIDKVNKAAEKVVKLSERLSTTYDPYLCIQAGVYKLQNKLLNTSSPVIRNLGQVLLDFSIELAEAVEITGITEEILDSINAVVCKQLNAINVHNYNKELLSKEDSEEWKKCFLPLEIGTKGKLPKSMFRMIPNASSEEIIHFISLWQSLTMEMKLYTSGNDLTMYIASNIMARVLCNTYIIPEIIKINGKIKK